MGRREISNIKKIKNNTKIILVVCLFVQNPTFLSYLDFTLRLHKYLNYICSSLRSWNKILNHQKQIFIYEIASFAGLLFNLEIEFMLLLGLNIKGNVTVIHFFSPVCMLITCDACSGLTYTRFVSV